MLVRETLRATSRLCLTAQRVEKRCALLLQFLFQPRCAIAIATGPGLGPVFVAAIAAVVCVLHARQFEILFPVGLLFL